MAIVALTTQTPLPYGEWLKYQDSLNPDNSQSAYFTYVQNWYENQSTIDSTNKNNLKKEYIQLIKDLSFLFASSETNDPFLKNIDYSNDEELIYSIPFFAKKLRQIAVVFQKKRESLKQAKLKYNLIGSNDGLEKLLYDYVLKGFTNTENSITQVPASQLISYFPDLSAVKDNFYIELEELYDTQTYFDSDPSVAIQEYLNSSELTDDIPLDGLSNEEIDAIISTRFLPRVAETTLSNVFKNYILNSPNLTTASLSSAAYNLIYNEIKASEKYLGETVYGLTAIRLKEINKPDATLSLNLTQGNNWFYWPSGNKVLNDSIFNNTFQPIEINSSGFVSSSATGGTNYTNSDLIFTDKNGIVEGAWLRGAYTIKQENVMTVSINGAETRDFIFPFPDIKISSKGLTFEGYGIDDTNNTVINLLNPQTRADVLNSYYTYSLPNTSCDPIYINQTSLIEAGAYAEVFSPEADNIIKKTKITDTSTVYNEEDLGEIEQAYLYKFERTDLPISSGLNQIHWPILTYTSDDSSPITIKDDFCLPIKLSEINPSHAMVGSIAGTSFLDSDVVYKFNSRNGEPIEAAWLGTKRISELDTQYGATSIYDISATKCAEAIEGAVQSSLSFIANGLDKISFVWMDPDTKADDVFKYRDHLPTCRYGKSMPHNFYKDQDFQNPNPLNSTDYWKNCNCKSVNYSPIGHTGEKYSDYNGITDYLFADPDGLGVDFSLNSWSDTRGFDVNNSPQFAYYKITDGDTPIGWGKGYWKNGNNTPFILKTGRRYTYYRSSFRKDNTNTNNSPYFVSNYAYKNIKGLYTSEKIYDLVILIDISKSQTNVLDKTKTIVKETINKILNNSKNNVQISVATFGTNTSRISWLTKDFKTLNYFVNQISVPKSPDEYKTNLYNALQLAQNILKVKVTSGSVYDTGLRDLCSKLNFSIFEKTIGVIKPINIPQNGESKILIFSDGLNNVYNTNNTPVDDIKNSGIEIYGIDIGELSTDNNTIENISSLKDYFNLQKFLTSGDGDIESFIEYISMKLGGDISVRPIWYKAIRDSLGNWVETNDLSDMVINAGDYIAYVHRDSVLYNSPTNTNASFTTPSISFTLNVKLDGWDYINNNFDSSNLGESFGGKPFWGKVYTSPDDINNFYKGTMSLGGQIRFVNDYVPLHQPQISSMILKTGDNIQYVRKNKKPIKWKELLLFNVSISSYQWNKLTMKKDYSNLSDFLRNGKLDEIVNDTNEISDLKLESYSSFKPAYYNYYAQNPLTYNENLYLLNRCLNSFVVYNTGISINPQEPWANLDNVHYPTMATVSFPSQTISEKQVGEYLSPEKLGTPFYRGKGYTIEIDNDSLAYIDSISAERMFLDIGKYGNRNRGLTKKDQISPTKIKNISNKWLMEPYSSASKGGVMINTQENQKLTPYQTNYEIYGKNSYGLARQDDIFQFWTPAISGIWNEPQKYPLTLRQELPKKEFIKRKESLLTNKGILDNWRIDIFGNDYGIYKSFSPIDLNGLYMWFSADYGTVSEISYDAFVPDTLAEHNSVVKKWKDRSGKNNNLLVYNNSTPILKVDENNVHSIYFGASSNFTNLFNLNNRGVTMFVVGSYKNADITNTIAATSYQVMASFGEFLSGVDVNYITKGSLVFANKYGDFNFLFGNNIGYQPLSSSPIITQVELTDYYGYVGSFYPPTTSTYLFEAVFDQPYAKAYINGELFADNIGTLVPADSGNYYDAPLYSTGGFWVGSYDKNTLTTDCSVSEIIFYNRTLSETERKQVENYIFKKYPKIINN